MTTKSTLALCAVICSFYPAASLAGGTILTDREITFKGLGDLASQPTQVGPCKISIVHELSNGRNPTLRYAIKIENESGSFTTDTFSESDFPDTDPAEGVPNPAFLNKDYKAPSNIGYVMLSQLSLGTALTNVSLYYDKKTKTIVGATYENQTWRGLIFDANPLIGRLLPNKAFVCGNTGRMHVTSNANGTKEIHEREAGDFGGNPSLEGEATAPKTVPEAPAAPATEPAGKTQTQAE